MRASSKSLEQQGLQGFAQAGDFRPVKLRVSGVTGMVSGLGDPGKNEPEILHIVANLITEPPRPGSLLSPKVRTQSNVIIYPLQTHIEPHKGLLCSKAAALLGPMLKYHVRLWREHISVEKRIANSELFLPLFQKLKA